MRAPRLTLILVLMLFLLSTPLATGGPGGAAPAALPPAGGIARLPGQGLLAPSDWTVERIDGPSRFPELGNRSLALDAAGHPHIAYGGNDLYYAWHDGASWHRELVDDSPGKVGALAALALDAAGLPHIAYRDLTDNKLRYAHYDGSAWHTEAVDAAAEWYPDLSLAVDAAGRPHIAYTGGDDNRLRYAYYDGSAWQIAPLDGPAEYVSVAVGGAGQPHISYCLFWMYYGIQHCSPLAHAYLSGGTWITETVVMGDSAYISLVLDAAGRPAISYCDGAGYPCGSLNYAYNDGSGWQSEPVASMLYAGSGTSLALDAGGFPHIAFQDGSTLLKYAWKDGSGWQSETADSEGGWGYPSLSLDAAGRPHISHKSGGNLRYTYYDGTAWQSESVDREGDAGTSNSLALDAAGRQHVSYLEKDPGGAWSALKYAYRDGSAWILETVDSSGQVGNEYGSGTSLKLDPLGRPHIAYYDPASGDLKYARYDGTAWQRETVDSEGDVGASSSLALDAAGYPHISYYYNDGTHGGLKYAHYDGTAWHLEILSSTDGAGWSNSLALDAAGHPHIGYRSGWDQSFLDYAYYDGTAWYTETVDFAFPSGWGVSLVLDAAGRPHISYAAYQFLKYAWHDGAAWHVETVTSNGYWGGGTSLALDAAGHPHISYFNDLSPERQSLWYARYDGIAWQLEVVDSTPGWYADFTSLALDAADQPHISYRDDNKGAVKYASRTFVPVSGVEIDGPALLSAGIDGLYSATYSPPSATQAVYIAWDNGTVAPSAAYSWTTTGTHTLAVTASNEWGEAHDSFTVTVFYQPLAGVSIAGPQAAVVSQTVTYRAIPQPITASLPLTFTWDNGAVGRNAAYSWTMTGTYTLTVTATDRTGDVRVASLAVKVLAEWPYHVALPLIYRNWSYCMPLEEVTVAGPSDVPAGSSPQYTASYAPPEATTPITFTWDNGTIGSFAYYIWPVPGSYTLTVTATNRCSEVSVSKAVTVSCEPLTEAGVVGPLALPAGDSGLYTATYAPPTATLPITFTWDNGTVGPSATYSWAQAGYYTLTVTATNLCAEVSATQAVTVFCLPVEEVVVNGPLSLAVGEIGLYAAYYLPLNATPPVTLTWDNGTIGYAASYNWAAPGVYTVTATATNECGQASASLTVTVCQPVEEAIISGPLSLQVGEVGHYTASYAPPTTTLPITLSWDNGTVGPFAVYSWTVSGTYTLTVTATNPCGLARGTLTVVVGQALGYATQPSRLSIAEILRSTSAMNSQQRGWIAAATSSIRAAPAATSIASTPCFRCTWRW